MNIAIISPEFSPYTNWGGVATFNQNLSTMLAHLGHSVYVVTYDGLGNEEKTIVKDMVTIHYIRYKTSYKIFNVLYYRFVFGFFRGLLKKYLPNLLATLDWNVFSFFAFRKLNRKVIFHVISSPTYHAPSLFVSIFYRHIPTVLYVQGPQEYFNEFEQPSLDNQIKSRLEQYYMITCSVKVVACSKDVFERLKKQFPKKQENIVYIPNFIPIDSFINKSPVDKRNIVYWGRLEYRKGVDILLKSFVELAHNNRAIKLYLIGKPSNSFRFRGTYETFATVLNALKIPESVKERIFVYPQIDDKKALTELLKKIKGIAVFPSRYEPFGFVIIEAMALGYLVIASNKGGGREIITHGINGLLVRPTEKSLSHGLRMSQRYGAKYFSGITEAAVSTVRRQYAAGVVEDQIAELYKMIMSSI